MTRDRRLTDGAGRKGLELAGGLLQRGKAAAGEAQGRFASGDKGRARLVRIVRMEDSVPLTVEEWLVLLVDAVHSDEERELSDRDVRRAGKRRQRRVGAVGALGGPIGLRIASLYCEAELLCEVVERHQLGLSDDDIAAHLLTLWNVIPDTASAMAAVKGTGPSVVAWITSQMQGAQGPRSEKLSKKEVVTLLWNARESLNARAVVDTMRDLPGSQRRRDVLLPGRRVKAVIRAAEAQLGVAADKRGRLEQLYSEAGDEGDASLSQERPAPDTYETQSGSTPLLRADRLGDLDRVGREHYGPPYPGPSRRVTPSAAELLLEAASAMGVAFPTPGSEHWAEYERRVCTDLLRAAETYSGWTIAGALCVAIDLDLSSQSEHYLAILDQAAEFLQASGVPAALVSPAVVERRIRTRGSWRSARTSATDEVTSQPQSEGRSVDPEPDLVPLDPGEARIIRVVHRPDGNTNQVCVTHRRESDDRTTGADEPINFVAVLRSTDSDPDGVPRAWHRGPSLRSVYILVAEAAVNAPAPRGFTTWNATELEWYITRCMAARGSRAR